MGLFKRPIIWAMLVFVSTIVAVLRILPALTQPSARSTGETAVLAAPAMAPARSTPKPGEVVIEPDSRGHHRTFASSGGSTFQVLVDTGASLVVLTEMDASNLGFRPMPHDFNVRLATANGVVMGARYRIDRLSVGAVTVRNVEAVVLPRRALAVSLLGQSFLRQLVGYEVRAGRLILRG
jgi:aspartyl protease family protein